MSNTKHKPARPCPANAPCNPKRWQEFVTSWECENGFEAQISLGDSSDFWPKKSAPIKPKTIDVLYSLSMDSDVLESSGFEEWASNFGYETDSRKADSIYRACLEIALKLKAVIGNDGLEQLRLAFQDY